MKLLACIFLSIFLTKNCDSQNKLDLKTAILEYKATSRGFYKKINIKNQIVSVSKDRENKDKIEAKIISDKDWNELIGYFKEIKLDSLPLLQSTSKKRFRDGAAIANFEVTLKGKNYATASFDHQNPPAYIKKIVDKINTFAKKDNEH